MNDLTAKTIVNALGLTDAESFYLRMVAKSESGYGSGWRPPGTGSNNWGAITAGPNWTGPTFEYFDRRADGTPYVAKFRVYPTAYEGAKDLARVLLKSNVRAALAQGDFYGAVRAQIDENKYTGSPPATPAPVYAQRLIENGQSIQRATGEALAFPLALPEEEKPTPVDSFLVRSAALLSSHTSIEKLPTLRRGDAGPDMAFVQAMLGDLVTDGWFGPVTQAAVMYFQRVHNLKPDGIIGPKTWKALHDTAQNPEIRS